MAGRKGGGATRSPEPKNVWRFDHERETAASTEPLPSRAAAIRAFTPWILLTAFVFTWGLPQMKKALDGVSIVRVSVPYLDKAVVKVAPVVAKPERRPLSSI